MKLYKLIFIILCGVWMFTGFASSLSSAEQLAVLEKSSGGRLGIAALNTANGMRIQYRANEQFPMGCTSKVVGVATVLKKSMTDSALLQKRIMYTQKDVDDSGFGPITKNYVATGMTVEQLCAAAISYSDNAAMNLLVKELGGLQTINVFARSIGDNIIHLDRMWPEEAVVTPENLRDATTPAAMEKTYQILVLGEVLALPQRTLLKTWLIDNTTGDTRIRAGIPNGWVVGDKTGVATYGSNNDVAIVWPPHCAPIVLAVYFTQYKKDAAWRDDVIASATRIVLNDFIKTDPCLKRSR